MFLVRWAAIALVALEAAAAALYSFLLASVAAAYWQAELTSRQPSAQAPLSWLDVLTQTALLAAVVGIPADAGDGGPGPRRRQGRAHWGNPVRRPRARAASTPPATRLARS